MDLFSMIIGGKLIGGGGSAPVVEPLSVAENGTYEAPSGVDGYSPVTVDVQSGGGGDDVLVSVLDRTATTLSTPSGLTKVGQSALSSFATLTKLIVNEGCTTLEGSAIAGCSNLQEVYLPSTLHTIKQYAFNSCSKVDKVVCKAITPPTMGGFNANQWKSTVQIFVPAESVEAYKTATNWSARASGIQAITD